MILPEETRDIRKKIRDFTVRVIAPRATEIYEGTDEIQRMIPARAIFGRDVAG